MLLAVLLLFKSFFLLSQCSTSVANILTKNMALFTIKMSINPLQNVIEWMTIFPFRIWQYTINTFISEPLLLSTFTLYTYTISYKSKCYRYGNLAVIEVHVVINVSCLNSVSEWLSSAVKSFFTFFTYK